ncbi:hypothetical protein DNTS_017763 [Danionella cerebrum]|uniref:Uncharacterized protein n=1 Tax=Danionella cerebrum TaxID=2873325 RepID=A0A553PR98_9TELE|nr:hypothetical protein DNTS_017763 [Danionella translucida]
MTADLRSDQPSAADLSRTRQSRSCLLPDLRRSHSLKYTTSSESVHSLIQRLSPAPGVTPHPPPLSLYLLNTCPGTNLTSMIQQMFQFPLNEEKYIQGSYPFINEDSDIFPVNVKCKTASGQTSSDVSASANHREGQNCSNPRSTTEAGHRYKTHTELIKQKLDQIKADMQEIYNFHLGQRPQRKAYHPFVWNSLRPYKDTTEIDHILKMRDLRGRQASN